MSTWSSHLLRAGRFRLDGGSMFGIVPRAIWSRSVTPDDQNCIPLQTNCLLLENEGRRVLIEAGNGGKWSDKERTIYGLEHRTIETALEEVGVHTDQIDLVIVTHLHFDHAGGLTRRDDAGNLVPTFPRADIVVQQQEWDDARAGRSTMTGTYLSSHLEPIADRIRGVSGSTTILDGIEVMPTPGHTWGHQSVLVDGRDGPVCFPGDLLPTRNHLGRSWSMGYDMLPYETMLTKTALLERAVTEDWRLILDHEPGEAEFRIERDEDRSWFTLVPDPTPRD